MVTLDQIYHASYVLRDVARKTDMIEAAALSSLTDCSLFLKTENLQLTGSFKLRGAYYKISKLSEEQRKAGILACSAGNHAQGVALAASRAGLRAVICMPDGAPMTKVEATKGFGAEVVLVKGGYDDAYAHACRLRDETGMTVIFITHDIGLAYYISDSVYIMEHGKFVEYGKPDKVMLEPEAPYTKRLISDVPKIHEPWDLSTVNEMTKA